MKLYAPSTIREIKDKYGFKLSKSLGQNFLTDKNIIDKIIEATEITDEDLVIEIGPGIGVLTAEAAQLAKKVVAVEIDRNLIPILRDTLKEFDNIEIINKDVLKADLNAVIAASGCKKTKIIGNLPYYITTPIIMGLLESHAPVGQVTVMVQKEVADRMQAGPGSKDYGALSLAVQYYAQVYLAANVPPNCFIPRPNVGSAVIRLDRHKQPPVKVKDEGLLFALIRASFNQRRKTLQNGLNNSPEIPYTKGQIGEAIKSLGLPASVRGEALTLEQFGKLADYFGVFEGKEG